MNPDNQMLSPKEVAAMLGVHPKTVHLWLRKGKLAGTKISYRTWRIPRSALAAFIETSSNAGVQSGKIPTGQARTKKTGEESLPAPPVKPDMKHYIRDILGEEP
jgi:excisionase family DNA binding protein